MYLIKVEDLHKQFKNNEVHKGISFNVKKGESLAIIGSNGAGKTVLANELVGLITPDQGDISINTKEENNISLQFQDNSLSSSLKTKEITSFFIDLYKNKITKEEVEKLKDICGINDLGNKKFKKMSGGQKQRVNLFISLLKKAEVIILDEFMTGLDVMSVQKIIDYLNNLRKENRTTLIIISHNPEELRNFTERILLLKDGVIENEYKTKEIESKYKGNFHKFLLEVMSDE